MNVIDVNNVLAVQVPDSPECLPHFAELKRSEIQFRFDFGLDKLPEQPGILLIRGARQYGKSTWLERELWNSVVQFGPGSAYYLNGDDMRNAADLIESIKALLPLFAVKSKVKRLFIDEITAVDGWAKALKRLADGGLIREILIITTGSRCADLRHGSERMPGRKGRLDRTNYLFTPVSFNEFKRIAGSRIKHEQTLQAYMLTGGSPAACTEIVRNGYIREYAVEIIKDWIVGECARSGRSRSYLFAVMENLLRRGGSPVSQLTLAREAGMANNTVAAGYIEMLCDLMCITTTYVWDPGRKIALRRKPHKLPFCNTLVTLAWHPSRIRSADDWQKVPEDLQAAWSEWQVAQELWRRAAIRGDESPEEMLYWQGAGHEVDFVLNPSGFIEVKKGKTSPVEFAWFSKVFPGAQLTVISRSRYETQAIKGITMEDFLLEHD